MPTVLLIDAANVVGARPDGWWRDRAGATQRLLGRLAALAGQRFELGGRVDEAEVVAVVEGRARAVPEVAGIRLVRAAGSGDDALVAEATALVARGRTVVVVTADRGLRDRLPEEVRAVGPGALLALLDGRESGGPA